MHDRAERLALVLEAIAATDSKDRLPQDGTVHATLPAAVAPRGLSARRHSALSTSGALVLCANLSGVIPGRPEGPGPESTVSIVKRFGHLSKVVLT
jgi:hypothetical protein